jgi:streptogramin lyase
MVWAMLQNNGMIWFSPYGGQAIWNFDPAQNVFDTVTPKSGTPFQMKDVGGEIWFSTLRGNSVGVIEDTQNGTYRISEFNVGNNTGPAGIFLDKNSLWLADVISQNIVQYQINRQGNAVQNISLVKTIPQNNSSLFSFPTDLHVYNDVVWLTEHGTSFLTSYDINNGTIARYPTSQNTFHTTTLPFWIRGTKEPNVLWFNEHQGNKIGRFDISNKTLTEYSIPSLPRDGYLTYPLNISQDPHDEKILWFSEWNTDKVAMINGHVLIPFTLNLNDTRITLHKDRGVIVGMKISANPSNQETITLNASSTITTTSEL